MELSPAEELELIEKVRSGDHDAFEPLVREHQKKVYNLALKLLRDPDDAEDAAQESFIKAYTSLDGFRADSRFSVWLYRITYNICLDFLRRKKRENEVSLSTDDDEGREMELQIPDERSSPEKEYEKAELRALIREGLDTLTPEHRQILIMREISDMSYADIASALGLSEGTVKSRISRARHSLAEFLTLHGTSAGVLRHKTGKEAGDSV